jgi:hypothetical protein
VKSGSATIGSSPSRPGKALGRCYGIGEADPQELEQFFVIVTMMTGKKVRGEGWEGPKAAKAIVNQSVKIYERGKKR